MVKTLQNIGQKYKQNLFEHTALLVLVSLIPIS